MEELNKFLTEEMGDCYHEFNSLTNNEGGTGFICDTCEESFEGDVGEIKLQTRNDFLTWEGFGLLWEWASTEQWCCRFLDSLEGPLSHYIEPENFAKAVAHYLQKK